MTRDLASTSLWQRLLERTERALESGALQPIATDLTFVEQDGIRFRVHILGNVARKDRTAQQRGADFNPFLPYDPEMFVADLSPTHLALLNKFNVVDHHLLVVTRCFEPQESLLTCEDFHALAACMRQIDGLAFYNAGRQAGASQRHKHLQLVPLALSPEDPPTPIDPLLTAARYGDGIGRIPAFPYRHACAPLDGPDGDILFRQYERLRRHLGIDASTPYNLLATRRWLLLVPRSRERWEGLSINAMGFAGSFLVRSREQLERVRARGILDVLRSVALPI